MSRLSFVSLVLLVRALVAQPTTHTSRGVGTVHFETSCARATQSTFNEGVAWLHSFGFPAAVRSFNDVLAKDSTCAVAYWGLALSAWGNPFAAGIKPNAQLDRGAAFATRGRDLNTGSERERAYVAAVTKLYNDYRNVDQRARVVAYRDAMGELAARYPRDDEASVFYAAALAFSSDPNDKTYENRRKAGTILERLSPKLPDHPGIAHYLIHAYDVPPLANKGMTAANDYASIAPMSAHALHMPSHTFTRVGKWESSIGTNIRSEKTALDEASIAEALHADDYLMYAYLQTGRDSAAAGVLNRLDALAARFDPNAVTTGAPPAAGFFAMAAMPARYAIERGDWESASKLTVRETTFPFTDAITWFARGIGGARSGDTLTTADAARQLDRLRDALATRREAYWSQQVEIQRRGVSAWLTWARGARSKAIEEMRATADLEATTEKDAMTPGPILPARELLAEMLLENGDAAGAVREFEATTVTEPGRFRSIAGAMRAAKAAGDAARATRYARQLTQLGEHADRTGRPDLVAARALIR